MGYTDSPKRKIITIIAWLAGAAIGGFAVYFFSEVPVDQPRVVAKKVWQAKAAPDEQSTTAASREKP